MRLQVEPASAALGGRVQPPGDKSVSHRAALFGGLAEGTTRIHGFLEAEDTLATLHAMQALGAEVRRDGGEIEIRGGELRAPETVLDLGNAGTGIRLLAGALAGHRSLIGQRLVLTGDASLQKRPMGRIIRPLARMGAQIEADQGRAPLTVRVSTLHGCEHELEIASAQVKSAILLAGLQADGRTSVIEPGPSRDHTERLLPAFGAQPERFDGGVAVSGPVTLQAAEVTVPGDLSSAAFLVAAALLVPDSAIELGPVGLNPTRDGFLRIVEAMAPGRVQSAIDSQASAGDEPVGTLTVRAPDRLQAIDIPADWVPLAIDEFPIVMAMAAAAEGVTRIRGAAELRVKESDRLAVMAEQLGRLGVRVDEYPDGADVYGGAVNGGVVDAGGDHRIAMSLAVLALVANGPVAIDGAEWIRTSYPGFVDDLAALGARAVWA
ncbi:MAG: 3-phosphoshikimate 1-carboxyvinyltransferase [Wenzhouxiangellaceae bacterium]|nr:3-phosphoshikimate 1-carboxyvinyltransferase [Wenzhouxiangellaceae bacterium]